MPRPVVVAACFLSPLTIFNTMKIRNTFGCLCLFVCLFCFGCGGGGVQFTGKVTFDDGSPVSGGTVIFESGSLQYDGIIQADGSYSLRGATEGSGIPFGSYQIAVVVPAEDDGKAVIATKYSSAATSGLTFEVKSAGPRTFDIKVERP